MAPVAPLAPPPTAPAAAARKQGSATPFDFHCLVIDLDRNVRSWSTTFSISLILHAVLVAAVVVLPILTYNLLPEPGGAVRAFFVAPVEAAPPPPPPPPAPAAVRVAPKVPVAPTAASAKFVAPIEVPDEIKPEEGIDLGVEGGVPGGVEGGVPGGVLGGIVGGLPAAAPPPAPKAVRVGGQIKQPKLLNRVDPVYPELAQQARLSAMIIMEALVGTDGRVKGVTVLRGAPLFDDAAVAAVKQWRYQPLLLNGIPTEFILTVTINFNLATQKQQ